MQLCQLARHSRRAGTEHLRHFGKAGGDAGRCLEPDCRRAQPFDLADLVAAGFGRTGEKAGKHEPVRRQARNRERGQNRAWPGNRKHHNVLLAAGGDKLVARIGYQRRAGIADENNCLAVRELVQKPGPHRRPIMVMIGDHPCASGCTGQVQQLAGDPCVLAGDDIGAGQHLGSARRKIAEIADWCGDEGECAGCHDGATAGKWVLVQDIAH